jgi:chemotaxis protein MotB
MSTLTGNTTLRNARRLTLRGGRHLLLTALCGLTLAGCVSSGKYDALMKEHEALTKEQEALRDTNTTLSQTITEEKNVSKEKAEQSARLQAELDAIKAKAEEQKATYAKLVKELSGELDTRKLTIEQMKNGINVNLTEDILFPSGSATLRESGRDVLAKVAEQLQSVPYQIIVSGFTDNVPIKASLAARFPSNWDLAAARATNVVRLLEEQKVPAVKLVAASFGENQPVADNETEEGRKQNRRIEIRLRPVVMENEKENEKE